VAIASPTTTADLSRVLETGTPRRRIEDTVGLEALRDALAAFTGARYAAVDAPLDGGPLTGALEAGRAEAGRLARARRWAWLRRLWPRWFRDEAARP
jgi:hypothetical protein